MSEVVPEGWKLATIGALITESRIPLSHDDPSQRLAVRLHLNGVEKRSERATDGIGATKYFKRRSGQFVYGKQNLHKGALGLIPTIFDGYSSSQDIPCFDIDQNVNAVWFLQYFMQVSFYEGLERIASGTGSKRIQPSNLFEEEILTPPLLEQKKIAAILTSVDDVIETTQKQIDKLQDLKKATMNELLTKGIGHTEFKDSELGRIPKSWEVGKISEIAGIISGYAFSSSDFVNKGVLCIRMGNLYGNNFDKLRSPTFLPDEFITQHPKFVIQSGDLLMSMTGTAGKRDYGFLVEVPNDFDRGLLNQRVSKIVPNDLAAKSFICELMRSEFYLKELFSFGSGTKQANLSASQIMGIVVPIPPLDEQVIIGETISSIGNSLLEKVQKLTQTQSLKKSLMQDLLTGKVRVKVD